MNEHNEPRKQRRRAASAVKQATEALALSQQMLRRGDLDGAAKVTALAERLAKLADRLVDLKAALKRIAQAQHQATVYLIEREARLAEREAPRKRW